MLLPLLLFYQCIVSGTRGNSDSAKMIYLDEWRMNPLCSMVKYTHCTQQNDAILNSFDTRDAERRSRNQQHFSIYNKNLPLT